MRLLAIVTAFAAAGAVAQNCGPLYGNQICSAGNCCSQYGWCDKDAAHCDPTTCLKQFSGTGSSCKTGTPAPAPAPAPSSGPVEGRVPVIDVCGHAAGGVSCPGAGPNGYFYRCCSAGGHCGPKNDIQDQALYCGTGCQKGWGKCNTMTKPAEPAAPHGTAGNGEACGPLVNKKCATGLCCSGSNFCGTGVDFCGAANWCQARWGHCS